MARTTIFPTQEISYDFLYMDMVPAASITPAPFALEPGQTYAVQWGENLFENLSVIDAGSVIPGALAIGNGSGFELPGNNEPFGIAYFANDTGGEIVVFFLDGNVSQTITVYQGADTPIVLKDRTGTGIEYEGVEGVRVFDKDGNAYVFVPPAESEEKTVELDFSGGAMEITPSAGKLLSKVGIPVPETLVPENIAKDVDIAGVVGTHEGGGGDVPFRFVCSAAGVVYLYNTYGTDTVSVTLSIPLNAEILRVTRSSYMSVTTSGSTKRTYSINNTANADDAEITHGADYTVTENPTASTPNKAIRATATFTNSSTQKWGAKTVSLLVEFTVPGFTQRDENGSVVLHGDNTITSIPSGAYLGGTENIEIVDLTETAITTMPPQVLMGSMKLRELRLPETIAAINYPCIETYADEPLIIDLSRCKRVIAVGDMTTRPLVSAKSGFKFLIPAELYDDFINGPYSYWADNSDKIITV